MISAARPGPKGVAPIAASPRADVPRDRGADGVYLFNTGGNELIGTISDEPGLRAWDAVERPVVGWLDAAR